jgi:hypothetical protein
MNENINRKLELSIFSTRRCYGDRLFWRSFAKMYAYVLPIISREVNDERRPPSRFPLSAVGRKLKKCADELTAPDFLKSIEPAHPDALNPEHTEIAP